MPLRCSVEAEEARDCDLAGPITLRLLTLLMARSIVCHVSPEGRNDEIA
jgi:hypothetical protein